jgi:hypothetical protein
MKTSPKLVFALLAVAACAASAETYSSQDDAQRRERNREEALTHYRAGTTTAPMAHERRETPREEAHEVAESTRHGAHKVAESSRHAAHETAEESRHVGHKVAVKARESTARADAKFGTVDKKEGKGEGSNPTGLSSTSANGPKP